VALVTHNLYFLARGLDWSDQAIMTLMLAAYTTYLINCAQFFMRGLKARKDRLAIAAATADGGGQPV
jgi:3-vinyl bacteriochlorophyllide hydratase